MIRDSFMIRALSAHSAGHEIRRRSQRKEAVLRKAESRERTLLHACIEAGRRAGGLMSQPQRSTRQSHELDSLSVALCSRCAPEQSVLA